MRTELQIIEDRDKAILHAREIMAGEYFVLDTETTGLSMPEMCQLAYVRSNGFQFHDYVKPSKPIDPGAVAVHHITDAMVRDAMPVDEIIDILPSVGTVIIYNAPFDLQVIKNSMRARNKYWYGFGALPIADAMLIYSAYKGEWDDYHGNYRWHKLEAACKHCKIEIDVELHDALADCLMTEKLMKYIAAQPLSTDNQRKEAAEPDEDEILPIY